MVPPTAMQGWAGECWRGCALLDHQLMRMPGGQWVAGDGKILLMDAIAGRQKRGVIYFTTFIESAYPVCCLICITEGYYGKVITSTY